MAWGLGVGPRLGFGLGPGVGPGLGPGVGPKKSCHQSCIQTLLNARQSGFLEKPSYISQSVSDAVTRQTLLTRQRPAYYATSVIFLYIRLSTC